MKKASGFTLVEIMIVTAIAVLLASLAIPGLLRARQKANEAGAKGTLKLVAQALEAYTVDNSIYPNATSQLIVPNSSPPYLNVDFFSGPYFGYTFTSVLTDYTYVITANPLNSSIGTTFTLSTGGVIAP